MATRSNLWRVLAVLTASAFLSAQAPSSAVATDTAVADTDASSSTIARQQELLPLVSAARADAHFAGAYFDDDRLTVVSTAPQVTQANLADLVPLNATVDYVLGANDYATLVTTRDHFIEDAQAGPHDFVVKSLAIDPRRNRVVIGISEGLEAAIEFYQRRLAPGLVEVHEEAAGEGGLLACTEDDCGTKGGLKIKHIFATGTVTCTSGFLVRRDGTSSKYMLTAGHCIKKIGGITSTVPWKNGAKTITWGKSLNYEFDENGPGSINNDQGVFSLGGVVPTAWNQYFTGSPSPVSIVGELDVTQQVPGIVVCRYGITSGWGCGTVTRTDLYITLSEGTILHNTWEVRHKSAHGDSGAGYIYYAIYGVYLAAGVLSAGDYRSGVDYTYYFPTDWDIVGVAGFWQLHPCATATCNT
jgi:hypothetical protein